MVFLPSTKLQNLPSLHCIMDAALPIGSTLPLLSSQNSLPSFGPGSGSSLFGSFAKTRTVAGLLLLLLLIVAATPDAVAQQTPINSIEDATVSIESATVTEGGEAVFTVRREGELTAPLTVYFSTKDGSAKAGEDYNSNQGTFTFSGDTRDTTIRVQTTTGTEAYYEVQETFEVELFRTSRGGLIGKATGTINESGTRPTLTVNRPVEVTEGDSAEVTLELSDELANDIYISFFFDSDRTATEPADYEEPANRSLRIPRGSLTGSVTIQTTDDNIAEPDETLSVNFQRSSPYSLSPTGGQRVVITIKDDDDDNDMPIIYLAGKKTGGSYFRSRITLEEGETGTVEAMLTSPAGSGGVVIPLEITHGPSGETDSSDFTAPSSITVPEGEVSGSSTFTVKNDTINERFKEGLLIEIGDPPDGFTKGDRSSLEVFMQDNDPNSIEFKNLDPESIDEDGGTATFELHLVRPIEDSATGVPFGTSDTFDEPVIQEINLVYSGVEDSDFKSDTRDCDSLEDTCEVTITAVDNDLYEEDKELEVSLGFSLDGGGLEFRQRGGPLTLTIEEDEEKPSFSIEDGKAAEGGRISFTVKRGGALENQVSVKVATADDTTDGAHQAVAGVDYTAKTTATTLNFGKGVKEQSFEVQTTQDTTDENDETFLVKLSESAPAEETEISDDTAIGTVEDNDDPPTVSVTNAKAVTEGNDPSATVNMTFTVNLSAASGKNITVPYGLSGTAMSGDDYTAPAQLSVSIAAGTTSGTITIPVKGDILHEPNETVVVTLSEPVNATLSSAKVATGTITDDDTAPTGITLTVSPDEVGEEDGETEITVTAAVNGATRYPEAKTVRVSVGGGTATSTDDYGAVTSFDITIGAGEESEEGTFKLNPANDTLAEGEETVDVTGVSGALTITRDTITIEDNDTAPTAMTITVDADTGADEEQDSVTEDGGAKTVRVTATLRGTTQFSTAKTVTIKVGKAADTATEGTDYRTVADQTITIAAGAESGTVDFTLTPEPDTLAEGEEVISVEGTSAGITTVTNAQIKLEDNDTAPTAMTITVDADTGADEEQDSVTEDGGAKTVRVTATLRGTTQFSTAKTVTIKVGKAADTATEGTDYRTVADQTITIAAGAESGTVDFTLTPEPDTLAEGEEVISVEGTSAGITTVTNAQIKLEDNDTAPTAMTITVDADTGADEEQDSVTEDGGAKTVRVTATLRGTTQFSTAKTVTIKVGKAADTATEGTDYRTVADQTITIAAGAESGTVDFTLTPEPDTLAEGEEVISVEGTSAGITTVTNAQIKLEDNDTAPTAMTITVDADTGADEEQDSVTEDGGAKTVRVTATLRGTTQFSTAKTVTIKVGKAADTATEGTDYRTVADQTITIAAGAESGTVDFTLTPEPDTLAEGEEVISVEGTSAGITTVTNAQIKLEDNDTAPTAMTITVDADTGADEEQDSVTEDGGAKTVRVTATLRGTTQFSTAKTVTIKVGKAADTATEGTDYRTVADQTITIAAGAESGTVDFTLTPEPDTLAEGEEVISVEGTSAGITTVTNAQIKLEDNDTAPTAMTITVDADTGADEEQDSVTEDGGAKTVRVTATLRGTTQFSTAKTVTIKVGKAADTATEGTDYRTVADQTITIAAGAESGTVDFTLTPEPDTLAEGEEVISVEGTSAGITTVTNAQIKLEDNDTAPTAMTITVDADTGADEEQDSVTEDGGAKTVRVTATLRGTTQFSTAKTVTIKVGKAADTATEGTDYRTVADQTITIAAGAESGTVDFTLTPEPDTLAEGEEVISVEGTSAGITTVTNAQIKLEDNDTAPTAMTITVDADTGADEEQDSVTEDGGAKTVRVTATLRGTTQFSTAKTVTIKVGKAADTATEGTDYRTVADQTITIAAGAESGTVDFTLTPEPDTLAEGEEVISVEGTSAGITTVTNAQIKLEDNDTAPTAMTITVDADTGADEEQDSVTEDGGAKTVRVTATLRGTTQFSTAKTVTIKVGKAADTATEGTDYRTVADQTITIAAGAESGTVDFTLTPEPDTLAEGEEVISVEGTSAGITTVTNAQIKLEDNDTAPTAMTITVDADTGADEEQDSVTEDGGAKTVRVTATLRGTTQFSTAKTVTIKVGKAADTATEGTDYRTVADQTITIAAGAESGTVDFTLTPEPDTLAEGEEVISVEGTSAGITTVTNAQIKLEDNDTAPTAMTITVDADTGADEEQDSVTEDGGAKTVRVTATLRGTTQFSTAKTVTIKVGKAADTATEGTDYRTVADQTITIAAGAESGTVDFTLTPEPDTLAEGEEVISVEGTSAGITTVTNAQIKLEDNDTAPTAMTITVDADTGADEEQDSVTEDGGAKTVRVTATLRGTTQFSTAKTVTIKVGKAADTATEGTDYRTVADQTITIAAGAESGTVDFTLTPEPDTLAEGEEVISVEGTSAGITTVTNAQIKLEDNDTAPTAMTITVDADTGADEEQDSVTEDGGAKTVRVTATLRGTTQFSTAKTVTIKVGKAADTATEGTDYRTVADQTITIAAGAESGTVDFTLTPEPDTLAEGEEVISVEGTSAGITTVTNAQIKLEDNDTAPTAMTITVDADTGADEEQDSVTEDGGAKTVRVTATLRGTTQFSTAKTVTIKVGKAADTATEGTDYRTVADQTITIAAGAESGTVDFTLTPEPDTLAEGEEVISVEGTSAGITTVTNAQIKLEDNDTAPTAMTITVDADTGADEEQDSVTGRPRSRSRRKSTEAAQFPGAKTVRVKRRQGGDRDRGHGLQDRGGSDHHHCRGSGERDRGLHADSRAGHPGGGGRDRGRYGRVGAL